jgi:hypothetical protein
VSVPDPALVSEVHAAVSLRDALPEGDETRFRCPNSAAHTHGDADPSARWNLVKAVWRCPVCGEGGGAADLARRLGVRPPRAKRNGERIKRARRTAYEIRDIEGALVATHVRLDMDDGSKSFIWERNGRSGLGGMSSTSLPLYGSERLNAAQDDIEILITEGEKATDALIGLGLVALGTVTGAATVPSLDVLRGLSGRNVILWPDNDDAGGRHMETVAARLLEAGAATVRIIEWQDAPVAGDAADFVAGGGAAETVRELMKKASPWTPARSGSTDDSNNDLPEIDAGLGDLATMSAQAMAALESANEPPFVFRHGGVLVRLERDERGTPGIQLLTVDRMRHRLARVARFTRGRGASGDRVATEPPIPVVRDLLAHPEPEFPVLSRIVEAPVFAPDGTLQVAPGYHPASKTYFAPAPGFEVPAVTEQPGAEDVEAATRLLLEEYLGDFPFVGDPERAHALGALLLPFARDLIDGPTPLHLIEKPAPGTGATLLVEAILFPALGRVVAGMTEGGDEDEWRKRLTAQLLRGPVAILIDNLRDRLDSAALSSAITAAHFEDRRLGASELVCPPVRCLWIATGNNPALSNEIARRTVRIRLDSRRDQPWLRDPKEFRHSNLIEWMRENRSALVQAALVLIRNWLAAGRPESAETRKLGMYESWSTVIGGILRAAGVPGFLQNLMDLYDTADAEGKSWRAFVDAWWEVHVEGVVGVSDLMTIAERCDFDLGDGTDRSRRIRFGRMLAGARDRTFGCYTILDARSYQGASRWRLVNVVNVVDVSSDPHARAHTRARAQEAAVKDIHHIHDIHRGEGAK